MELNIFYTHPYLAVGLTAFLSNILLGYIRENCQRFSFKWFFWIHASIPLLIYLRITVGVSGLFIPISIALAIAGQILGSRLRKKRITVNEQEKYDRIPDLGIIDIPSDIHDSNVMVALLNMGGPRTNDDVAQCQNHLFRDPLLIRFPLSSLLQPFFAWLLVKLRGHESKKRYALIGGGSPIFESTQKQGQALQEELKKRGRNIDVTFSFNYSEPFPEDTIKEIKEAGKKYILPISLYPHYSSATTGSNLFYLNKEAQRLYPDLKFLQSQPYFLNTAYINAFVDRIYEQIGPAESLDDFYLIFSAHGLPLYFLNEGDPYPFQIAQTVGNIVSKLKRKHSWVISYQSAVGPLQWLKPLTDSIISTLSKRGVKKLLIIPVSFVTDHIETLCEIDIEYRQFATDLGIEDFRMIKALECHPDFIGALADSVESALTKDVLSKSQLHYEQPA